MRLLDLFCGAGGAAEGYRRAGFTDIVGVDIEDHSKSYPFCFVQGDALEVEFSGFDAIHASPPCQRFSGASGKDKSERRELHKDYLRPIRTKLIESGLLYVIENVPNAPLINPLVLCGTMFPTLRLLRHRLFESNFPIPRLSKNLCYHHPLVYSKHNKHLDPFVDYVTVAGGGNCPVEAAKSAMDIDWMNQEDLSQAIPPPYTEYIGKYLIHHIKQADQLSA